MKHAEDLAQCKGALGGYGKKTGKCGDTIEFFVTEENGILKTVSYKIDGCAYTESCACTTALLAEGKSVEQAWEITPDNIFNYLKTLPQDHFHCAELSAGALYQAMSDLKKNFTI